MSPRSVKNCFTVSKPVFHPSMSLVRNPSSAGRATSVTQLTNLVNCPSMTARPSPRACTSQENPASIPSQMGVRTGSRFSLNHITTTATAALMLSQAAMTAFLKLSLVFHRWIRMATMAAIAMTTHVMGLASTAALKSLTLDSNLVKSPGRPPTALATAPNTFGQPPNISTNGLSLIMVARTPASAPPKTASTGSAGAIAVTMGRNASAIPVATLVIGGIRSTRALKRSANSGMTVAKAPAMEAIAIPTDSQSMLSRAALMESPKVFKLLDTSGVARTVMMPSTRLLKAPPKASSTIPTPRRAIPISSFIVPMWADNPDRPAAAPPKRPLNPLWISDVRRKASRVIMASEKPWNPFVAAPVASRIAPNEPKNPPMPSRKNPSCSLAVSMASATLSASMDHS